MDSNDPARKLLLNRALELFQEAYDRQLGGQLDDAVSLYNESIEVCPTAEAHTFLGWTYSFQGKLTEAIAECQKAIELDPDFGNPYNDIGAYLIELEKYDEAIPWLERAVQATRYETYHIPWFNLGRAFAAKEHYGRALECLRESLTHDPEYAPARDAVSAIRLKIH